MDNIKMGEVLDENKETVEYVVKETIYRIATLFIQQRFLP